MKNVCLAVFVVLGMTVWGQKVKVDDGVATVDGVEYVMWDLKNMGNEVSVKELNGTEEVLFIIYRNYSDPSRVSNANPEGKVRWEELNFLTLGIKCEVQSMGQKGLIKLLYENEVFIDGKLNEANARKLVSKYGTNYSDNRPAAVIIINN